MQASLDNVRLMLLKLVTARDGELAALLWSFIYFFALLCSYYIIRPMRDEMGILGGVDNLQWLFTGTLIAMTAAIPLFGWVSSRFPRRQFLPAIYLFFIFMLLLFYLAMALQISPLIVARSFFIWSSVFNLFVVSVFWSFMADLYTNEQAQRLFPFIAAGGTLGALSGPAITVLLVQVIGTKNLLLLSALLLLLAIFCIKKLSAWSTNRNIDNHSQAAENRSQDELIGGGIWSGLALLVRSPYLLGISLLMLLFTTLATFLYFMQAHVIAEAFQDSAQRTAVFAAIDLAVNALTLLGQLLITSRLINYVGLAAVLAIIPLLLALGLAILGFFPLLPVLLTVQVIRRAGNYAIMRPAREMLYVVLSRAEKYKAKNIVDTVIYRAGDAISAWVFAVMRSAGLSLSGIAFIAVPIALLWAWLAFGLGKQQSRMAQREKLSTTE